MRPLTLHENHQTEDFGIQCCLQTGESSAPLLRFCIQHSLSLPIFHSLSPLFTSSSLSSPFHSLFQFPKSPLSRSPFLPLLKMACLLAWLSIPVKCNPKSAASSPTTILMVMGSILYQGYHILLEMTVSKVGVDAMGTKTGGRVRVLGGCVRERLCV